MRFVNDSHDGNEINTYHAGPEVICAGLPRCATSTLEHVLENDLGFAPCMHMAHVAPHVDRLKLCVQAMKVQNKRKRQELLAELFNGYRATADFPGMMFVEDLVEMYPHARLILNQRASAAVWEKSISGTLKFFSGKTYAALTYLVPTDYWHAQVHVEAAALLRRRYGNAFPGVFSQQSYRLHNDDVRRIAKAAGRELLEWQPSDGWAPLCRFLGRDAPTKELPRLNDENVMKILRAFLVARGVAAWVAALAVPAAAAWGILRFVPHEYLWFGAVLAVLPAAWGLMRWGSEFYAKLFMLND